MNYLRIWIISKTKYEIHYTKKFKKQYKKIIKQNNDLKKLRYIVENLSNGAVLEEKYKDHNLVNNKYFDECRECHIEPDWLLVYKYTDDKLILLLVETGSHSELFKK